MTMPAMDAYDSALDQLRAYGLIVDALVADGQFQKVPHVEDKPGKKKGWYCAHEHRLADGRVLILGGYGWWPDGAVQRFRVEGGGLSDEDRRAMAAKRRDIDRRAKAEREQLAQEAARRALEIWPKLPTEGPSPYLARKRVAGLGVRYSRGSVVVPLRTCPDDLIGLQWISPDGTKKFLTGTAKTGAYHLVGEPTVGAPLAVCEGYATFASVHMATGWACAMAFDCGNLLAVAKRLVQLYPGAQLVLCADDDHATAGNPGISKARAAAEATRGLVAVPQFATPHAGTDWNDLHVAEGLEAVTAQLGALDLSAAAPPPDPPPSAGVVIDGQFPGGDWQSRLMKTPSGVVKATSFNTRLILDNDPAWRDVLGWCDFSHRVMKRVDPPLEHASRGEWDDVDDAELRYWLAERYAIEPKGQDLVDAVMGHARVHAYHPVRDYLDGLRWDGKPRIDWWLPDYLGCDPAQMDVSMADANRYLELVGSLWLIQAVSRVRKPGHKADSVLILEGTQGAGKSTALRVLFGEDWFSDTPIEIGSKDSYEALRGLWCLELAELDALSKADARRAKAFFSSPSDRFRVPYGRRSISYTRQCVVAGTTNEFAHLKDYTGNRRYWSVSTGRIALDLLHADRDQLWAEADHRFRAGEHWWPQSDDARLFADQQDARMDIDVWESLIRSYLRSCVTKTAPMHRGALVVSTAEIMQHGLNIDPGSMRRPEQTRVGQIVHRIGWRHCRPRVNGERLYGYRPSAGYLEQIDA